MKKKKNPTAGSVTSTVCSTNGYFSMSLFCTIILWAIPYKVILLDNKKH